MNITDILGQIGGLQSMATELGISQSQAAAGAAAPVPAGLGGLGRNGGLGGGGGAPGAGGGLASMLDSNHDGHALDDVLRVAGKLMR